MRRLAGLLAAFIMVMTSPASAELHTDIFIDGTTGKLGGTLVRVENRDAPVAVIVPGSGPTDRNGDNSLGIRAQPYKLLAEALAARGVTNVRIDKRGMFGSAVALANPNDVTLDDYADDLKAWGAALRGPQPIGQAPRCIWLIGHSEGGLAAIKAATMEGVCGLVLLASPGRRLGDVLRAQLRANPANAPLLAEAEAAVTAIENGRPLDYDRMTSILKRLFNPSVDKFLRTAFAFDPSEAIATLRLPVLIVQGGRDIQVLEEDAARLASAQPAARRLTLPLMNHVLKTVFSDDPKENVATYGNPDLPLAEGLADGIAAFIFAR